MTTPLLIKTIHKSFILKRTVKINSTGDTTYANKQIPVKNLGWLIRHWREIEYLSFNYEGLNGIDGQLVGKLKSATYYSDLASLSVCWSWLDRPIFRGLQFKITWLNYKKEFETRKFVIGDEEFKSFKKESLTESNENFVNQVLVPKTI